MKQRIIIIGGMGPQASLELHRRFISRAVKNGAIDGTDFPLIVHASLPVPEFLSDESKKPAALQFIVQQLRNINVSPGDIVIIACNTAHLLQKDLEQALGITITSLIDTTADFIAKNHTSVKLLASPTTIRTGLYTQALRQRGVGVIEPTPEEIDRLETIIRAVIACENPTLQADFTEPTLLGCTELSCAFAEQANTIDPMNIITDYLSAQGVL